MRKILVATVIAAFAATPLIASQAFAADKAPAKAQMTIKKDKTEKAADHKAAPAKEKKAPKAADKK